MNHAFGQRFELVGGRFDGDSAIYTGGIMLFVPVEYPLNVTTTGFLNTLSHTNKARTLFDVYVLMRDHDDKLKYIFDHQERR
jgi:hypothetical protein